MNLYRHKPLAEGVLCLLLAAAMFWLMLTEPERRCIETARAMELEYHYGFHAGCMVRISGKWFPIEESAFRQLLVGRPEFGI